MIAEPIRMTQTSATLIDHIYASNPCRFLESGCLDAGVSDHLMVFLVRRGRQVQSHKIKKVRAFKMGNVDSLLADLASASWEVNDLDIDSRWNNWKNVFFGIHDRHAPIISCCVRRNALPWIDADIRKLMRRGIDYTNLASRSSSDETWNG